ncbi:MAG: hypothetical protein ACR2PH_04045, partial [Desulfobulbia bacterium]
MSCKECKTLVAYVDSKGGLHRSEYLCAEANKKFRWEDEQRQLRADYKETFPEFLDPEYPLYKFHSDRYRGRGDCDIPSFIDTMFQRGYVMIPLAD